MGISKRNSNAAISRATHLVVEVDLKERSRFEVVVAGVLVAVNAACVTVGDPISDDEDCGGCLLLLFIVVIEDGA